MNRKSLIDYIYIIVIVAVSVLTMVIMPLWDGTNAEVSVWDYTGPQLVIFIVQSIVNSGISLSLFYSFKGQAHQQAKKNENYIKARHILNKVDRKKKPISPLKHQIKQQTTKGITLVLFTFFSGVAISNLVLNFNILTFYQTIFSVGTALLFGFFAYMSDYSYYTEDYLIYAEYKEALDNANQGQQGISESSGTGSEEQK